MSIVAVVKYKGGLAHYEVVQESALVYTAHLSRWDGKTGSEPQQTVILVRSERGWEGNTEQTDMLKQIGAVLDTRLKGRLHHLATLRGASSKRK